MSNTENLITTLNWQVVDSNNPPVLEDGDYISYYRWESRTYPLEDVEYNFEGFRELEFYTVDKHNREILPYRYPTPHLLAKVDFKMFDDIIDMLRGNSEA
jgi:hypothetical protein